MNTFGKIEVSKVLILVYCEFDKKGNISVASAMKMAWLAKFFHNYFKETGLQKIGIAFQDNQGMPARIIQRYTDGAIANFPNLSPDATVSDSIVNFENLLLAQLTRDNASEAIIVITNEVGVQVQPNFYHHTYHEDKQAIRFSSIYEGDAVVYVMDYPAGERHARHISNPIQSDDAETFFHTGGH